MSDKSLGTFFPDPREQDLLQSTSAEVLFPALLENETPDNQMWLVVVAAYDLRVSQPEKSKALLRMAIIKDAAATRKQIAAAMSFKKRVLAPLDEGDTAFVEMCREWFSHLPSPEELDWEHIKSTPFGKMLH